MRDTVVFLCYDLPVQTKREKRNYQRFAKYLKQQGYIKIQKSIAIKYLKNGASYESELLNLEKNAPIDGEVYMWNISFKKYSSVAIIRGSPVPIEELRSPILEF